MTKTPMLNMEKTGKNLMTLLANKGYTIKDVQNLLGFSSPQAIYKWKWGQTIPSLDNMVILSFALGVPIDSILVVDNKDAFVFLFINPQRYKPFFPFASW